MMDTKKVITITEICSTAECIECQKDDGQYERAVIIRTAPDRYEIYCKYDDGDEMDPVQLEDREPEVVDGNGYKQFKDDFMEHLSAF